jgi:hypothetical protein
MRHAKTQHIIDEAHSILAAYSRAMTVRQVFYRLVSRQVVENTLSRYKAVSDALVDARREGSIPWVWIEDRTRRPRGLRPGWVDVTRYLDRQIVHVADAYSAAVWPTQPQYVEVWLEKDALSGIFEDALAPYSLALNVGRGYDGWSSIHNAAERFRNTAHGVSTILYFGDFDPSGEDMVRSLQERLYDQNALVMVRKVALTPDDILRYQLPPNVTKVRDSRAAAHIAEYGDVSVELDALPPDVLHARVIEAVEDTLDMDAMRATWEEQKRGQAWLAEQVAEIQRWRATR